MQRFTISLDDNLAQEFDRFMAERGHTNRSEAVRDMLHVQLAQQREQRDTQGPCVATLSYVYDHHERELSERLAKLQHGHYHLTIASTHVHLDHDQCLETVLLKGPADQVRAFAHRLMGERGVHHGQVNIVMSQAMEHAYPHDGEGGPGTHHHPH